jgi:hypothetical protein
VAAWLAVRSAVLSICLCDGVSRAGAGVYTALALRKQGITPRMSLAGLIVAVLLVVANAALAIATGFADGLPPLIPLIPALLLGIGLVRAPQA